uniref:Kelch domain-containing protein n=1 Tax=Elaeophora elaphi TaxID=1147741 RepID=A0A0R3RMD7_9BILA
MVRWIVNLLGGPEGIFQAAVAIEHKIYSVGCCYCQRRKPFGVHVLNTIDYRWKYVPTVPFQSDPEEQFIAGSGIVYQPYGEIPPARTGHTLATYQGMVYMWGGYCAHINMLCSKLYCFNPEQRTWSVIPSANEAPFPREKHTAVVHDDVMFIYGGMRILQNHQIRFFGDVWAYHFKTRKWYVIVARGEEPPGRARHTACVIKGKMYVFGGINASSEQLYLDVLNLQKNYWERPRMSGRAPEGAVAACSWVHNNKMYVFGGNQPRDDHLMIGLYQFDPETSAWRTITPFGLNFR